MSRFKEDRELVGMIEQETDESRALCSSLYRGQGTHTGRKISVDERCYRRPCRYTTSDNFYYSISTPSYGKDDRIQNESFSLMRQSTKFDPN